MNDAVETRIIIFRDRMNRRKHLRHLAGLAAVPAGLPAAASAADFADEMARFARHWDTATDYLLAVFDAMPAEHMDFRPSADQMSFAGQFSHVGYWSTFLFGAVAGRPPMEEPETDDPAVVRAYVAEAYGRCRRMLDDFTPEALARDARPTPQWAAHTGWEMLGRAYMHTAHHRGQAVVYLRMKDIRPPWFRY